jgi:putative DNA primase/helicase
MSDEPIDDYKVVPFSARGPILDPRDPMKIARALVEASFTAHGHRCIHHYRGGFYQWNGSCYRQADDDTIKANVWTFLESARRVGKDDKTQPFRPNKASVANVIDALQAVSNLPKDIEAPTWLGAGSGRAPAAEILPVSNGLLHLPTGRILPPSPAFFGMNAATLRYDPKATQPVEFFRFMADLSETTRRPRTPCKKSWATASRPTRGSRKSFSWWGLRDPRAR